MIAYIVSTYQLPRQAIRLIRQLSADPSNTCLVHHDANAPAETWMELTAGLRDIPNVHFLQRRQFRYATFDHVRITLDGFRWLFDRDVSFSHVVLLTGQCYPLMSAQRIVRYLEPLMGRSVMSFYQLPFAGWSSGGLERVNVRLLRISVSGLPRVLARLLPHRSGWLMVPKWPLIKSKFGLPLKAKVPTDVGDLFGGDSYWAISRHHAEHILSNSGPYVRFFQRSCVPDELFFQTMLMNSPFKHEVVNGTVHEIDWSRNSGPSPYTWRLDDLGALCASGKPFARKFDERVDADILDSLDSIIESET